jgi:hypothetical protein
MSFDQGPGTLGLVGVRVVPERPGVRDDESVLERSARFDGGCTASVPSISAGTRSPCQWIVVGGGRLFVNRARMVSPTSASISGPGTSPLKAKPRGVRPGAYANTELAAFLRRDEQVARAQL